MSNPKQTTSTHKLSIRQQYDHLLTLSPSQLLPFQQFQSRLSKQILKQQASLASNTKIINNLKAELKQLDDTPNTKSLVDLESQKQEISSLISTIKRQIKALNSNTSKSHREDVVEGGSSQNLEYQYQLEVKKNNQYKKRLEELDRSNEPRVVLPQVQLFKSRSGEKQKKESQLNELLSVAKAKAAKNQQVYLGNISSKQSKIKELERSEKAMEKSIQEMEQEIQQIKQIGM